jgi:hypothetical protein
MASFFGRGPWERDFGRRPKNTFDKHYRIIRKGEAVYDRIEELRKANPVDPALFERVAAEFGVSAGTASALYYSSATRGSVADRDADREISQIEATEIGLDPDRETRERWWEQNSERINEIIHRTYRAAHEKRPKKAEADNF